LQVVAAFVLLVRAGRIHVDADTGLEQQLLRWRRKKARKHRPGLLRNAHVQVDGVGFRRDEERDVDRAGVVAGIRVPDLELEYEGAREAGSTPEPVNPLAGA